jgi:acyl carrier protein
MTEKQTRSRILEVITEALRSMDLDVRISINEDTTFKELNFTPSKAVVLISLLEYDFESSFPDNDVYKQETVGGMIDYLERHIR